jgi:hypothetical protein
MSDANINIPNNAAGGSSQQRDEIIFHTLKTLGARVTELKENIENSATMLPLGVDTDLVVSIKKTINDPISQLLDMKQGVDETVYSFITLIVKKFFENHRDKIQKAFRTETGNDDLHFSIILNEDTDESRESIFDFLRNYKNSNLGKVFPVSFQFIPKHVADRIAIKEIIIDSK